MLAHPPIIERLYMNKATRMSTADRIIELAVRNKLELTGIPAYKEVAIAIGQELIARSASRAHPLRHPLSRDARRRREGRLQPVAEDTHVVDDEGEEKVADKFVPLYARIAKMTIAQKIRAAMLGTAAERMLLMRDGNRLVAVRRHPQPTRAGARGRARQREPRRLGRSAADDLAQQGLAQATTRSRSTWSATRERRFRWRRASCPICASTSSRRSRRARTSPGPSRTRPSSSSTARRTNERARAQRPMPQISPVAHVASSSASTTCATSSGVPKRPSGERVARRCVRSGSASASGSATMPSATMLMRT